MESFRTSDVSDVFLLFFAHCPYTLLYNMGTLEQFFGPPVSYNITLHLSLHFVYSMIYVVVASHCCFLVAYCYPFGLGLVLRLWLRLLTLPES